jgi:hypothetical protein
MKAALGIGKDDYFPPGATTIRSITARSPFARANPQLIFGSQQNPVLARATVWEVSYETTGRVVS